MAKLLILHIVAFIIQPHIALGHSIDVYKDEHSNNSLQLLTEPVDEIESELLRAIGYAGFTPSPELVTIVHCIKRLIIKSVGRIEVDDETRFKQELAAAIRSFVLFLEYDRMVTVLRYVFASVTFEEEARDAIGAELHFPKFVDSVRSMSEQLGAPFNVTSLRRYKRSGETIGGNTAILITSDDGLEVGEHSELFALLDSNEDDEDEESKRKKSIIMKVYKGITTTIKSIKAFFKIIKKSVASFPLVKKAVKLLELVSLERLHGIIVDYLGSFEFINGQALKELNLMNLSIEKLRSVFIFPDVYEYATGWTQSMAVSIEEMVTGLSDIEVNFKSGFENKFDWMKSWLFW